MKYYEYKKGIVQVPEVKHPRIVKRLLDNANEIAWAKYLEMAKDESIVEKLDGELYFRRPNYEIDEHSNINENGYSTRHKRHVNNSMDK